MNFHGKDIKIFAGNSNADVAQGIAGCLGLQLGKSDCTHFSDGEIAVSLHESVRGSDCFIVQSTCTPVNDNLMEMLIMIDAMKRASAKTGQKGKGERSHLRKALRRYHHHRRCGQSADHGPARKPDSGLLQYPC